MIFLNSANSPAALVFYLPGVCTYTDTEGKQKKARVQNILKSLEKNTILNEHPVYSIFQHCHGHDDSMNVLLVFIELYFTYIGVKTFLLLKIEILVMHSFSM